MHSAPLCAGLRRRQATAPVTASVAGVKGEEVLHIMFDFRRGETEVQQVDADPMTMAQRPTKLTPCDGFSHDRVQASP
jgi:hypothetical protein